MLKKREEKKDIRLKGLRHSTYMPYMVKKIKRIEKRDKTVRRRIYDMDLYKSYIVKKERREKRHKTAGSRTK